MHMLLLLFGTRFLFTSVPLSSLEDALKSLENALKSALKSFTIILKLLFFRGIFWIFELAPCFDPLLDSTRPYGLGGALMV